MKTIFGTVAHYDHVRDQVMASRGRGCEWTVRHFEFGNMA